MPKSKSNQPVAVRRDGGLCVTFVNSASAKRKSFGTYVELLAWGQRLGAVSGSDAERLGRTAAEHLSEASAVLQRALELRSRFKRILEGLIERKQPTDGDLEMLGEELASARAAQVFARSGIGCRWVWGDRGGDDLDRMLWPVVMSMEEVLSTKYCFKVGRCAGDGCDLLFVDRSGGSARKWCSSRACGNKVRSRRDYHRRIKPQNAAIIKNRP